MSMEEGMPNGTENMVSDSSNERILTYKRKRGQNQNSNSQQEVVSSGGKKWRGKVKDIGWEHGTMVDGNRQHWQCNWCGLVRYGGGVTRLKRHLAGDLDVRCCPNVPADVAHQVRLQLLSIQRKPRPESSTKRDVEPTNQEGPDNIPSRDLDHEQDSGAPNHIYSEKRKQVLEKMILFPNRGKGGGVHSCILGALGRSDEPHVSCAGKALVDILNSEKFALLCDLLCKTFHFGKKGEKYFFDFREIDGKMRSGDYEQYPSLFYEDICEVWENFEKVGQEMVHLATSLFIISRDSIENQVGARELSISKEEKSEDAGTIGTDCENSAEPNTTAEPSSSGPVRSDDEPYPYSTSPYQSVPYRLAEPFTCTRCETRIEDLSHLITCKGCRSAYHFSCTDPSPTEILTKSWCCPDCVTDELAHSDRLHSDCTICYRLDPDTERNKDISSNINNNGNREIPVSVTAASELCKFCGEREDESRRFLICGHVHCPYKYYHIKCLRSTQIASEVQEGNNYWYCPSCLCRSCLVNRDDRLVILCDGCDEAYHIYCLVPPRGTIPEGEWYCTKCNLGRAREGMREYEGSVLRKHGIKCSERASNERVFGPLDLLISAVELVKNEEPAVVSLDVVEP